MTPPPSSMVPRDEDESILRSALRGIAQGDCWGREDDGSCNCPVCIAEHALKSVGDWRYEAALANRVKDGFHPAEARMVASWKRQMGNDPDDTLAKVLRVDRDDVTRRDWYVATSVVQWLGTNIGSLVVEGGGYKYTKYEEDRAARDEKLPVKLGVTTCDFCKDCDDKGFTYCAFCGRRINRTTEAAP